MKETPLFSIGFHKGEIDFSVFSSVRGLRYDQMKEVREMIVVGIGVMEGMWREANQPKPSVETNL